MNPRTGIYLKYWLPVVLYATLIFYLSSLPLQIQAYGSVLSKSKFDVNYALHIAEYGIFSFLLFRAFSKHSFNKPMLIAVIVSITYAATDEIHQLFVLGRSSSLIDMMFNSMGSFLAQSAILIKRSKRTNSKAMTI